MKHEIVMVVEQSFADQGEIEQKLREDWEVHNNVVQIVSIKVKQLDEKKDGES